MTVKPRKVIINGNVPDGRGLSILFIIGKDIYNFYIGQPRLMGLYMYLYLTVINNF